MIMYIRILEDKIYVCIRKTHFKDTMTNVSAQDIKYFFNNFEVDFSVMKTNTIVSNEQLIIQKFVQAL